MTPTRRDFSADCGVPASDFFEDSSPDDFASDGSDLLNEASNLPDPNASPSSASETNRSPIGSGGSSAGQQTAGDRLPAYEDEEETTIDDDLSGQRRHSSEISRMEGTNVNSMDREMLMASGNNDLYLGDRRLLRNRLPAEKAPCPKVCLRA